jgi:hypothetical protein
MTRSHDRRTVGFRAAVSCRAFAAEGEHERVGVCVTHQNVTGDLCGADTEDGPFPSDD